MDAGAWPVQPIQCRRGRPRLCWVQLKQISEIAALAKNMSRVAVNFSLGISGNGRLLWQALNLKSET
jgi:hypothetical protein